MKRVHWISALLPLGLFVSRSLISEPGKRPLCWSCRRVGPEETSTLVATGETPLGALVRGARVMGDR